MRQVLGFAVIAVAVAVMQGCSGSSNPGYISPTTTNPSPGVTLQVIQILPSTPLIGVGENRQLSALGTYSDGSTRDLTSSVTWSASSLPSTTSNVSVNSHGMATGQGVGPAALTATSGSVVGVLQILVDANSFVTGTTAILSVPYKTSIIDAAYLPQSQTMIQGAYAVQEVNLDADKLSDVLPVPDALLASVPMPAGFVPNAAAASQSNFLVAVISYSSRNVEVIDASNITADLTNNTVINTFTAPATQSVTFYAGTPQQFSCILCSAVVNPVTNQLLLSTGQGYYSMNLTTGAFTALPFTPAPSPAPNFSLNPIATDPYILATNPTTGEVQVLDLTTNAVTTISSGASGVTTPATAVIDPLTNYAAVVDGATNEQSLVDLTNPQSPIFTAVPVLGVCGQPDYLNMVAMGISANASASETAHTLFTSQTSGNCVGFEAPWPNTVPQPPSPSAIYYGYGPMPVTPDSNPFVNGSDPNAIAAFNSVYDKNNYGLLVDANQQWIAKLNLGSILGDAGIGVGGSASSLPTGTLLSSGAPLGFLCADLPNSFCQNNTVIYLPTPSTAVTVSVNSISFGSLTVGTSSPPISLTLANIGTSIVSDQISVQGTNAGDFLLAYNCGNQLQPQSSCGISVTFTPSTAAAESATLTITDDGGTVFNPGCPTSNVGQSVCLSGTGTQP